MRLKGLRSLLFVPATSTHLLAKATQRGADALILDLEDAIAPERKQEARMGLAAAVAQVADAQPVLVRVNADPESLAADIAALPRHGLAGVMLPKVESAEHIHVLVELLQQRWPESEALPIVALIESPLGIVRLESISTSHSSVVALGFGAEDYATCMAVAPEGNALRWAAHAVANGARAFGLACWGLPGSVSEIDDMQAYGALVKEARSIGFSGTVCIHPRQVGVANSGFSPADHELDWAREVVEADERARAAGQGAVRLNGRMIDRPVVERARQWLEAASRNPVR